MATTTRGTRCTVPSASRRASGPTLTVTASHRRTVGTLPGDGEHFTGWRRSRPGRRGSRPSGASSCRTAGRGTSCSTGGTSGRTWPCEGRGVATTRSRPSSRAEAMMGRNGGFGTSCGQTARRRSTPPCSRTSPRLCATSTSSWRWPSTLTSSDSSRTLTRPTLGENTLGATEAAGGPGEAEPRIRPPPIGPSGSVGTMPPTPGTHSIASPWGKVASAAPRRGEASSRKPSPLCSPWPCAAATWGKPSRTRPFAGGWRTRETAGREEQRPKMPPAKCSTGGVWAGRSPGMIRRMITRREHGTARMGMGPGRVEVAAAAVLGGGKRTK
mmetsp:Transcript_32185/g.96468  ORF Transcript_32185/g.96468 Transcript_32185/m.96468 type:complete len:327 (-) Transcript_32185:3-983(-)